MGGKSESTVSLDDLGLNIVRLKTKKIGCAFTQNCSAHSGRLKTLKTIESLLNGEKLLEIRN